MAQKKNSKLKKPVAQAGAKSLGKKLGKKPVKKALKKSAAKPAAKPKVKLAARSGAKSGAKLTTKAVVKAAVKKPSSKTAKAKVSAMVKLDLLFTPLDDRVLVEKAGVAERTPGGLYIPEMVQAADRPSEGKVVAVGRGHRDKKGRLRPLDVKLGDTVMFAGHTGSEVNIDGAPFFVLRELDILAVVKS